MDKHNQCSYTDVVGTPGKGQEDQSGQVVDDLLLKVLMEIRNTQKHTKKTPINTGSTVSSQIMFAY